MTITNRPKAGSSSCPDRPRSTRDTEFERRPMVDWFDPRQLVRTGARTALTHIFGDFFDRRELQAALATPAEHTYPAGEDGTFWFDYVADLGDGFNPTYTVAHTLARRHLALDFTGQRYHLPRGRILLMGGDQVYPVASLRTYEDRLIGPFRSALPCEEEDRVPHLFAIPGNHDWYDGLTSFLRIFVQQGWIGGWKTRQQRSYFAVRLPHDVWIWGIDSRTESRLDQPQLDYFRRIAVKHDIRGHRIILCAAEPGWVYERLGGSHRPTTRGFQNLAFFERTVIEAHGAHLLLTIAGDLHHYSRYQDAAGRRQMITSGGGGATLFPTHVLPDVVPLPQPGEGAVTHVNFERRTAFPSREVSEAMPRGALKLPVKSPSFSFTLGAILLASAWLLQSSSLKGGGDLFDALAALGPLGGGLAAMQALVSVALFSPGGAGLLLIVATGWTFFTGLRAWYAGLAHGILQIFLGFSVVWLSAYASSSLFPGSGLLQALSFSLFIVVPGGMISAFLVGLYLYAAHRLLGLHANEVLASQSYEDFKNFIRVRVDADSVTVFPIGFERVCRSWRLNTDSGAAPGDPWFEPAPGSTIEPQLIEAPIRIPLRPRHPLRSATPAEESRAE